MKRKYVTQKVALLLKGKGFAEDVYKYFTKCGQNKKSAFGLGYISTGIEYQSERDCKADWNLNRENSMIPYPNNEEDILCSAPEHWLVVEWFRDKLQIHIELRRDENDWKCEAYSISSGNKHIPTGFKNYPTPKEAEDGIFEHLLTM